MILSLSEQYDMRNISAISHSYVLYLGVCPHGLHPDVSSGPIVGEYVDEAEDGDDSWFPVIYDMVFEMLWGKLNLKTTGQP